MKKLNQKELQELILKCWMTHDAMWFYHCLQEFGIEQANKLNKSAINGLAAIEIDRVRKAFAIEKIENFEDVKRLLEAGFGTLTGEFMGFDYSFPSENVAHWEMKRCFAYIGMTRLGVIDHYECGVIYRVANWFDKLGLKYELHPRVDRCIMHTKGACRGEFRFLFG
ncbi:MAG: DUF6125 family protein [Desulfomonilaceae bacterium]